MKPINERNHRKVKMIPFISYMKANSFLIFAHSSIPLMSGILISTKAILTCCFLNMAMASKAYAFIKRRGYVIPEDVRAVCTDVLRHRIGLTYEAEAENITSEMIVNEILNTIEVP